MNFLRLTESAADVAQSAGRGTDAGQSAATRAVRFADEATTSSGESVPLVGVFGEGAHVPEGDFQLTRRPETQAPEGMDQVSNSADLEGPDAPDVGPQAVFDSGTLDPMDLRQVGHGSEATHNQRAPNNPGWEAGQNGLLPVRSLSEDAPRVALSDDTLVRQSTSDSLAESLENGFLPDTDDGASSSGGTFGSAMPAMLSQGLLEDYALQNVDIHSLYGAPLAHNPARRNSGDGTYAYWDSSELYEL